MNFLRLFCLTFCSLAALKASAQLKFTNKADLLTPAKHYSGVAIAVLDMNGDGLDDIARMDAGHILSIAYQTAPGQPFANNPVGNMSTESQWGMCAADIDNNGFPDVLSGGAYDEIKVARANADGSFLQINTLTGPGTFVQGVNFADINNDGWLDAFVCHDDGASRIFGNDGTGNLVYQPLWIDLATVPSSDNSGNYGSVWSDVNNDGLTDLYIAHCRQGVSSPTDPRRINQLFLNNGDGTYTQDIDNTSGLRIGAQSWTADFGDIDNDGDFDCFITNHDVSSQLLENDGAGHFTDITVAAGIKDSITGTPIQGVFRDFDNDGYMDILVAGSQQHLLHNNGDKTFTRVPGLFDNNNMESFAIGDLNHDGFQDIYGGYANIYTDPSSTPDALWINEGNDNDFFGLNLRGVLSNRNGVGAKALLYSALGVQVREVRSGESYGIMNSMQVHFGLGQATAIDSVVVRWPSGTVDVLQQPLGLNQYITVQEGGCVVPQVQIMTDGSTVFCSGDSVAIATIDAFPAYQWSNGDTTGFIYAYEAGTYSVTVTTADGCTGVSNFVKITVDPVEIPGITALGDTVLCSGDAVALTTAPAAAYLWSTGDTTQTIVVEQPGLYTVTTPGLCADFTSPNQSVEVLDAPPPVVANDTVLLNTPATLIASGSQPAWYDAPAGGNLLFEGDTFVTAPLAATTTFWVSNSTTYDAPNAFVGMINHQGTSFGDVQFPGAIIFDCQTPFVLARVKVIADLATERKIDLRDDQGNVIQSKTVFIQSGTSIINLDFDVPAGTDLVLTTDEDVNLANLGSLGPQLRRSSQGVTYPYEIANVVSLKNSNFGLNRYYYFYNWEIDFKGHVCTSERVPVVAQVDSSSHTYTPDWASGLRVFPNPAAGSVSIGFEGFEGGGLAISLISSQGMRVSTIRRDYPSGSVRFHADYSGLPKGIYWLEIAAGQGVVKRKLVLD
jgi:hypothetical protein